MGADDYRERVYRSYRRNLAPELKQGAADPGAQEAFWRRHYLPHLPEDRGAAILDLGCGDGALLGFLEREGRTAVSGVDASPEQAAAARKRGLEVEHGDFFSFLKTRPGRYDAVIASDVLEHLRKDEALALMDLVHAALKPGGVFVAQTINAESPGFARQLYVDLTHETAYTRYSLSQLFSTAGFSSSSFFALEPSGKLRRRLLWKLSCFALALYYHADTGSGIVRHDHIFSSLLLAVARR